MSGRRAKALRRAFVANYGRTPKPAELVRTGVVKADKMGLDKDGVLVRLNLAVRIALGLFRAIFDVKVQRPSEWRRWKKEAGNVEAFEIRAGWRSWKQTKPRDGYVIQPATEIPEAA